MNGKVLMLAIIFFGGFHVFYVFNRVQNFANIMNRLCTIQLGECLMELMELIEITEFVDGIYGIHRCNLWNLLLQNNIKTYISVVHVPSSEM